MDRKKYTHESFGVALADLLREHQHNPYRANLYAFADELPEGISYAALRLAVNGKVVVRPELIEACAKVLGVPPSYFKEYRVHQILEALESHPQLAGLIYETVMNETEALSALVSSARNGANQSETPVSAPERRKRPKPQNAETG
jgi:hypothetical protein